MANQVELNPVRVGIVDQPSSYKWSSYQINALGKESALCMPHPLYLALGDDIAQRKNAYRALFNYHIEGKLLEDIRLATNIGMVLGSDHFKQEIQALTGRRMTACKIGRPVG